MVSGDREGGVGEGVNWRPLGQGHTWGPGFYPEDQEGPLKSFRKRRGGGSPGWLSH